jgi:hypothetical protein
MVSLLYFLFEETAEIVSINPLIPQSWGIFKSGGHPQTPRQEVSCTSISAVSLRIRSYFSQ